MIQIISNNEKYKDFNNEYEKIVLSSFSAPRALDDFDINIIDLEYKELWKSKNENIYPNLIHNDFISLSEIIKKNENSKIIIILPQNCEFRYDWTYVNHTEKFFIKGIDIKDMLNWLYKYIEDITNIKFNNDFMTFEKTITKLNDVEYISDFSLYSGESITLSQRSKKNTTIEFCEIYYTTLNILQSCDALINYLKYIGLIEDKEEYPDWLYFYDILDDNLQQNLIEDNKRIIDEANEKISVSKNVLDKNLKYKSVLSTSDKELVEVVFEILEEILNYDLSDFEDKFEEDFLIKKEDITFIGEIKGVSRNVKSENVTQLDTHYQIYMEELEEKYIAETVKALLIINHQRTKDVKDRLEVPKRQIELAERNGSLIIETKTLLKIFEKFRNGNLTVEDCEYIFRNNTGLLKEEQLIHIGD